MKEMTHCESLARGVADLFCVSGVGGLDILGGMPEMALQPLFTSRYGIRGVKPKDTAFKVP